MTIKNYRSGARKDDDHRYEPPRDPFITKKAVYGAPDLDRATTSHVERNNGTMRHKIGRMRRLCYAFSKSPEHHRAAVALGYCAYNLTHVLRTTRITPAMCVGVAKGPWSVEELLNALLTAEPCDPPSAQPLTFQKPAETARELPNGRGFLRALPGGKGAAGAPLRSPDPSPVAPAAPAVASATTPPAASGTPADPRQLDLLAWRPKSPPTIQLSLFALGPESPKS